MGTPVEGRLGFITDSVIQLELKADDKAGVLAELVQTLVDAKRIPAASRAGVLAAVMARETLGSTGIGKGLAVPHAKACADVEELVGVFGRKGRGVEFGASDGEPSHLFFLLVSPPDGVEEHLQILRMISSLGRNEHFVRFLRDARSKDDILGILQEMSEG